MPRFASWLARKMRELRVLVRAWWWAWPQAMRVTLTDGTTRDVWRVIRHDITGTHLVLEDVEGCIYIWRLDDLRRYVPTRTYEAIHAIGVEVVG